MDASVFIYREAFYATQLRGIMEDIGQVYVLISQSGQRYSNDENTIRDAFSCYLQNDMYKTTSAPYVKNYQVDTEVREGTHGRTDIRFLQVCPYAGQQTYFIVECKRLDGTGHLSKEYVDNGIRRFTAGKYPTQLGCNAMLGFVVCAIDLHTTVGKVNNYLEVNEHLKTQSTTMEPLVRLESLHNTPHNFVLYHLWTDFSHLI